MVDGDNPAKGGLPVGGERPLPGLLQRGTLADAAGIGVLQDGQGRSVAGELPDQIRGGRQVEDVVVGKFLPVELFEIIVESAIEGGLLMGVLAVTQPLRDGRLDYERPRQLRDRRGRRHGGRGEDA